MNRIIKDVKTWQLIAIWQAKSLLTQWENKLQGHKKYAKNDWPRPMIQYIDENYNQAQELVGVEIGVAGGGNAFSIMNILPIKKLYLIDPYSYLGDYRTRNDPQKQLEYDRVKDTAIELLSQFGDRVEFIIKKSEDAVDDVPDNLDFVYIDGNHEYEYVKKDLELYYPKVKTGGIFGGDNFEPLLPGVARAVSEFTDKHSLKICGSGAPVNYEWGVIKK